MDLSKELYKMPDGMFVNESISRAMIELLDSKYEKVSDLVTDVQKDDIEDALYYLQACAENQYNHDYFRVFYNLLALIADNYYQNIKREGV